MINIKELVNDTSQLDSTTLRELEELVSKYPFFQTARLLYICNLYKMCAPNFKEELKKASIFVPDRTALFYLTENTKYSINDIEGDEGTAGGDSKNRTMSLINSYLADGGIELENAASASQEAPSLADLTNDYASYLLKCDDGEESHDNVPHLKGEDLIDSFITETQGKQRINMTQKDDAGNEENFTSPELSEEEEEVYTESMVNIYIKQGRYQQALEILRKICLNNPKKNSTFASQLNLLEIITKQQDGAKA